MGFDGGAQFLDEDGVGLAQQVGVFLLHFAQDANAQARPREGVTVDHVGGQAQGNAQFAHFVLEEVAQRLQQFQAQLFGQAADIVVALDDDGLLALGAARLDDVGVDGALGQEGGALVTGAAGLELLGFGLEDVDEQAADDLAFLLGVGDAGQGVQEELAGVDAHDLGVQLAGEHVHDHVAFVQPQKAMIDEDAGELVTDGAMDEGSSHAGIDATGQAQDDFLVAHLFADGGHGFLDVVTHDPVGTDATDVEHEALEHGPALHGVGDFGVELHAVEVAILVGHAGDGAAGGAGHELEAFGQGRDLVAVAHPHLQHAVAFGGVEVLDAVQQPGVAAGADFGVAEFPGVAAFHLSAQLHGHGLHAITDAQHGHAQLEDGVRGAVIHFIDAGMAAGEDDALELAVGGVLPDPVAADVAGMDFAVDVGFADAPRDELGDLRAEIQDQDLLMVHGA